MHILRNIIKQRQYRERLTLIPGTPCSPAGPVFPVLPALPFSPGSPGIPGAPYRQILNNCLLDSP